MGVLANIGQVEYILAVVPPFVKFRVKACIPTLIDGLTEHVPNLQH